jgi:hypothetical protein
MHMHCGDFAFKRWWMQSGCTCTTIVAILHSRGCGLRFSAAHLFQVKALCVFVSDHTASMHVKAGVLEHRGGRQVSSADLMCNIPVNGPFGCKGKKGTSRLDAHTFKAPQHWNRCGRSVDANLVKRKPSFICVNI